MDPFDYLRDIQRHLDGLRPAMEQYERLQRQLQAASLSLPVRDLLRDFEENQRSPSISAEFAARQRALFAAVQPIRIESVLADFTAMSELMSRVNAGIASATFLGELQLTDEDSEGDSPDGNLRSVAESRLVEIVPPEALGDLKRVEFAPLVLLDRALRDPEIMRLLQARHFEGFIAALIEQLGFEDVILTARSGDEGRDVLATKRIHGIPIMFAFECKRYAPHNPVGPDIARALLGTIAHGRTRASKGVLVTTSYFTPSARSFILTEPDLDGKDFDGIVEWLKEYGSKSRRAT
jgi:Restriction endonuclease